MIWLLIIIGLLDNNNKKSSLNSYIKGRYNLGAMSTWYKVLFLGIRVFPLLPYHQRHKIEYQEI